MFQIKILTSTPRSVRTVGGFTFCRWVMITWPNLVRQYHNGPNGMLWAEFVEA